MNLEKQSKISSQIQSMNHLPVQKQLKVNWMHSLLPSVNTLKLNKRYSKTGLEDMLLVPSGSFIKMPNGPLSQLKGNKKSQNMSQPLPLYNTQNQISGKPSTKNSEIHTLPLWIKRMQMALNEVSPCIFSKNKAQKTISG